MNGKNQKPDNNTSPKKIKAFSDVISLTASMDRKDVMKLLGCVKNKDASSISWDELHNLHDECRQAYQFLKEYQGGLVYTMRENEAVMYYADGVDYIMDAVSQATVFKMQEEQNAYNQQIRDIANQQRNEYIALKSGETVETLEPIDLE